MAQAQELDGMPGGSAAAPGTPAWWEQRYRQGEIPWDTGIVPPELERLAALPGLARGWALDLGCGTGLNSRFLARQGFRVIGLDLAISPLRQAARAAADAGLPAHFCAADVAELAFLRRQVALAVDIGCFHSLPPARRPVYVASLADHLCPAGLYLLYGLDAAPDGDAGPPGLTPRDIAAFAPWFALRWSQHGHDRTRPSAWYLLQRT